MSATIALGFFFAVSGYLFYNGIDTIADVKRKLNTRIYSLVIPFIIWNVIACAWHLVVLGKIHTIRLVDFVLGFTCDPFDGPTWYMFVLICMNLLSPAIYLMKDTKFFKWMFLIVISIISLICYEFSCDIESLWWFNRLFQYIPNYFIGAIFAMTPNNKLFSAYRKNDVLCIIAFVSSVIIIALKCTNGIPVPSPFINIINVLLPLFIFMAIPNKVFNRNPNWIIKNSFIIYVTHQTFIMPIIDKIQRVIGIACPDNVFISLVFFVVRILLLIAISMLLSFLLSRFLPQKLYKALLGGRINNKNARGKL